MSRLSPAQACRARKLEAMAIRKAANSKVAIERPETGPAANAYDLLRQQLGEHMRALSEIESVENKIAYKADMLAEFDDHIDTVILTAQEEGKALQDEVFVRLMIYHLDVASVDYDHYPRAFELADHVLKFGLKLPDNFRRSPAALIRELVGDAADAALTVADLTDYAPFPIEILLKVEQMTATFDIVDVVTAKLNKALGRLFALRAKAIDGGATDGPAGGLRAAREEALKRLKRALELKNNIGVKDDIRTLERALKNSDA